MEGTPNLNSLFLQHRKNYLIKKKMRLSSSTIMQVDHHEFIIGLMNLESDK